MRQKDIQKKKDEVMRNCRETLAMILFVRDEKIRPDLVVIDEGPRDEVEMCSDLKQGRIQHPRTDPAADKQGLRPLSSLRIKTGTKRVLLCIQEASLIPVYTSTVTYGLKP